MNLVCLICSDGISGTNADAYTTHCGHVFHYTCLVQWLERSKTCPQCRNKASEKTIHRIYLNLANSDSNCDAATLQNTLDNAQLQLMLKEKDIKILTEKNKKMKHQNTMLRTEVIELENKAKSHNSVVHALKDQISFFKTKAKEKDKCLEELSQLRTRLKQMESTELAITGSREEVTEMLKNEHDVDSLVMLVVTLKKALLDAEKKKINIEHKFKQVQNELTNSRRQIMHLELSNKDMKKQIEITKASSRKEVICLVKTPKRYKEDDQSSLVSNEKRLSRTPPLSCSDIAPATVSLATAEEKSNIVNSESPYLNLKKCSSGIIKLSSQGKSTEKAPAYLTQMTIFKKPKTIEKKSHSNSETIMYNGLGGHGKEDLYPTPKDSQIGVKRHRAESCISYSKYRKMDFHLTCKK